MQQEEMIKLRKWEKIITRDIKRDLLFLIRERVILTQAQAIKLLYRMGYVGRHLKEGKTNISKPPLQWESVHKHFDELENAGLIYRNEYPSEDNKADIVKKPEGSGGSKGVGSTVGFKLTAEGRDFLNSLTKSEAK